MISNRFEETTHVITNAFTDGPILDVAGAYGLSIAITNQGAGALNAFELWGRPIDAPATYPYFKYKASGFLVPDFFLLHGITDPTTLAASNTSILFFNVDLVGSVKLVAKSASTSTIIVSGAAFS